MTRSRITLNTTNWQLVASQECIVSITERGKGRLLVNSVQSDDSAHVFLPSDDPQTQVSQTAQVDTYVRAEVVNSGWGIVVDDDY